MKKGARDITLRAACLTGVVLAGLGSKGNNISVLNRAKRHKYTLEIKVYRHTMLTSPLNDD